MDARLIGGFVCGVIVGIPTGVALVWVGATIAVRARLVEEQDRQDAERAGWATLERWRRESDRMAYGTGSAEVVRPQSDILSMTHRRTR